MTDSKMKKFEIDPNNPHIKIRREVISDGKRIKEIIFRIDDLYIRSLRENESLDLESDRILEKERQDFNERKVQYDWEDGIGFLKTNQ